MGVSFIYCFRNREFERVEKSILSIYSQLSEQDEIIFIDYGSSNKLSTKLKGYFSTLDKLDYIYVETSGMLWNRGHCLNIGVKHSKNDLIITADIDLIYSNSFLIKIKKDFTNKRLLNYKCYYLPKNFKSFEKLKVKPEKVAKRLKQSSKSALGLMMVEKQLFEEVHGYDEYYRIWGMEDNDLIHRFEKLGVINSWFSNNDVYVFHQWHKSSGYRNLKNMPKGWLSQMLSHYEKNNSKVIRSDNWGKLIERSIFNLDNFDYELDISKDIPLFISQKMNNLIHLNKNYNSFRFYAKIDSNLEKSKLNRFVNWFNIFSNKFKIPFLLESEIFYFSKFRRLLEYRDLFYYFVLANDKFIEDYHIKENKNQIEFKIKLKE